MDIQLKRGMLEACVLVVLSHGDSYGYRLIKDISVCIEISESTLYPVLKRLEASGALTVYTVEHNGRLRKYYRITEAGTIKLADFREDWKEVNKVYQFISDNTEGEHTND